MTSCPNTVNWVPVSTTTKPVIQVADVAVNKASIQLKERSPLEAIGSDRSIVPIQIMTTKPSAKNWGGVSFIILGINFKSSTS
ncbi:hypothetical protein D3C73_954300 [compost metagenome]